MRRATIGDSPGCDPGLFESVYQPCLAHELTRTGLAFEQQVTLPVTNDGVKFQRAFHADFIIERELIVEVTYLRLSGLRKGLLINFNVPVLREGLKSFVM